MSTPVNATASPGLLSSKTVAARGIMLGGTGTWLPAGKTIDGTKARDPLNTGDVDVLRAGVLMGKITASGKYAPSILGVTTGAYTAGGTTLTVAAATVTELLRRIGASGTFKLTGPPSANGTVATATVTYSAASGTSITIVSPGISFAAGSFVQPTDGSETPLSFVYEQYGIKVTDEDGTSQDSAFAKVPITGIVDSSQIVNWPTDTSLQAWIAARLNSVDCCKFVMDHNF